MKLISLNIERSKHLDLVLPFLREQQADVVCLQEVIERDFDALQEAIGAVERVYAPCIYHPAEIELALEGDAIFSRVPLASQEVRYYRGTADDIKTMRLSEKGDPTDAATDQTCALVLVDVEIEDARFSVGTTHFTWTPKGAATDEQRTDMRALLSILGEREVVLTGDFNAPRGGEIFAMLAERFKDNVPPHHKTSIDITIHRAGRDRPHELADKMVDGLFTSSDYVAESVELVNGVSDHMAIVATIRKAGEQ